MYSAAAVGVLKTCIGHLVGEMPVAGMPDRGHDRMARPHDRAHDGFGIERVAILVRSAAAQHDDGVDFLPRGAVDRIGDVDLSAFTLNARFDELHGDVRRLLAQRRLKIGGAFSARRNQRHASAEIAEAVACAPRSKSPRPRSRLRNASTLAAMAPTPNRRDLDDAKLIFAASLPNPDRPGCHDGNAVAHGRKLLRVAREREASQVSRGRLSG